MFNKKVVYKIFEKGKVTFTMRGWDSELESIVLGSKFNNIRKIEATIAVSAEKYA